MTVAMLSEAVNAVASTLFLILMGATVFSMLRRVRLYRTANWPIPVLLRRGIVLFSALIVIGGESLTIRLSGIELNDWQRLIFVIQYDLILLGALFYYAKVEMFDLDDPDEK